MIKLYKLSKISITTAKMLKYYLSLLGVKFKKDYVYHEISPSLIRFIPCTNLSVLWKYEFQNIFKLILEN